MKFNFVKLLQLMLLISMPFVVSAANWYVDDNSNTNDIYTPTSISGSDSPATPGTVAAPLATLSEAINRASNGDYIYIDAGTWGRTGTYLGINNAINKQVKIIGAGSGLTLFDANNGANYFANITASNVTIKNMSLTRYFYDSSGSGQVINISGAHTGIVLDGIVITKCLGGSNTLANINVDGAASVTLKNSFLKCSGYNGGRGGGIRIASTANVTIDNVLFKQNENHFGDGGAIQMTGTPTVSVTNSTFSQCYSNSGGAIAQSGGILTVTGSCFDSNWTLFDSSSDGGGAFYGSSGTASFSNCSFTGNETTNNYLQNNGSSKGGAIYVLGTTLTLNICKFSSNNSSSSGEDIYINSGTVNVNEVRFESIYSGAQVNVAQAGGTVNFYESGLPTASPGGVAISQPETSGSITTYSNIGTTRTDVTGFGTWTDVAVSNTTQMDLKTATSSMTSPSYNITEPTANLKFDIKRVGASANAARNIVTVEYSTDGGASWTSLGAYTNTTTTFTTQTVSINALSGLTPIFRFSSLTADGTNGIALDNIYVQQRNTASPTSTASTHCVDASVIVSCAVASITCATEANPPVIFSCVPDKTFSGTCSSTMPDYRSEVVAYDDCLFTIAQSPAPGTPVSPGSTYTVTMTVSDQSPNSANATCTFTVTVTGTGISAPVLGAITQPTCLVQTGSVDLSGLPSSGTWTVTASPGGLTKTGTGTTTTFTGLTANTTYTFTVTDGVSGCISPASGDTTINAVPSTPAPTGDANQAFCSTANPTVANLNVTGTSIIWYTTASGGSVVSSGTALTDNTHYFASQTVTGCESTTRLDVLVTITTFTNAGILTAGDSTLCSGTSTTVSSTVSGGSWSSSNPSVATVNATSGLVNALAAGTSTMTYTVNGTGACSAASASATILIDVTQAPDAGIISALDSTLCSGSTTIASSTISGGTWTSSNPTVATVNSTTGLVNALTGGTTTLTYTVAGTANCSGTNASATLLINVTEAAIPGVLTATDSTLCSGTTTIASSTISGGTWSSSNPTVATVNSTTGLVNALVAGNTTLTYTVNGTANCLGRDTSATLLINVTQAPDAGTLSLGDTTLCSGSSTLVSSTSAGGTWSSSNTAVATVNATTGLVNAIAGGTASITYTVLGTANCAGTNATVSINVIVTQTPDPGTLSPVGASLCLGGTTTMSSTVTGGTWSSSNPTVASVDPNSGLVNALSIGNSVMTYTINGIAACAGKDSSASATINIVSVPSAGTLTLTDSTLCEGFTSIASSTSLGGNWASSDPTVASVDANSGLVTAIKPGNVTLTYTVVGTGSCVGSNSSATIDLSVTAAPIAGIVTATDSSLCSGTTANMSSTVLGGTWTSSNAAVATVDLNTGVVTAVGAGSTSITYTVAGVANCSGTNATASLTINVTAAPNTGVLSALDSTLCSGTTTTISSIVNGGVWTSSDATIATVNSSTGLISAIQAGSAYIVYTVSGTSACLGTNDKDSIRIDVTQTPDAGILSALDSTLCSGTTTIISSTVTGGAWTTSDATVATVNSSTGLISAIKSGSAYIIYTVSGTGACFGTDAKDSIRIDVTQTPDAGILSALDSTLCSGTTTTISSTVNGGVWTSSDATIATVNSSTGLITAIQAGSAYIIYTVSGTGACMGTIDKDSIQINVTQTPDAGTLSALDSTLCSGTTTTISSTVNGGAWSSSDAIVATVNSSTGLISAIQAGSAYIIYTVSGNGACMGTTDKDSIRIDVTQTPDAGILSALDSTLCSGTTTTISSTVNGGVWTSSDATVASINSTTGVISAIKSGTAYIVYTVSGTGACSGTDAKDSIRIDVTQTPDAGILSALDSTLCSGSTTTISSTVGGGSWASSDITVATVNSVSGLIRALKAGSTYIVYTVSGTGACLGTDAKDSIRIDVTQAPIAGILSALDSTLCSGTTTTISSTVNGGVWTSSDVTIVTVNSSTGEITAVKAGSAYIVYTVSGTGACLGTNAKDSIRIDVTQAPVSGTLSVGNTTLCVGSTTTISSTVSGGVWSSSNSSVVTVNPTTGVITGVAAGTTYVVYTISGTGACLGTDAKDSTAITVNPTPPAPLGKSTQLFCAEDSKKVQDLVPNGATIKWYPQSSGGSALGGNVILTNNTNYYATQTLLGCESVNRLTVLVKLKTVEVSKLKERKPYCNASNGSISVVASNGIPKYNYSWSNGDNDSIITSISKGSYTVNVTDSLGCSAELTIDIDCIKKDIPQIITPGGNGKNETFELSLPAEATVQIFNRWGNLIYTASPYHDDWDGKSNQGGTVGSDYLPSGTYFYVIDYKDGEKPVSGYVELVR